MRQTGLIQSEWERLERHRQFLERERLLIEEEVLRLGTERKELLNERLRLKELALKIQWKSKREEKGLEDIFKEDLFDPYDY